MTLPNTQLLSQWLVVPLFLSTRKWFLCTPNSSYMDFGHMFFLVIFWLYGFLENVFPDKFFAFIYFSLIWTILARTNVVHISGIGCITVNFALSLSSRFNCSLKIKHLWYYPHRSLVSPRLNSFKWGSIWLGKEKRRVQQRCWNSPPRTSAKIPQFMDSPTGFRQVKLSTLTRG